MRSRCERVTHYHLARTMKEGRQRVDGGVIERHLERAVSSQPDYAPTNFHLSVQLVKRGAFARAEQHLRTALGTGLEKAANRASAHFNLAQVLDAASLVDHGVLRSALILRQIG